MPKTDTRSGSRHKGTAKSYRWNDEQLELLEQVKEKHGGTYTDALEAGMRAYLNKEDITKADVLAWIADKIKD